MEISSQSFSESRSKKLAEVVHRRIDSGAGYSEQHKSEDTPQEHVKIEAYDSLDNVSIYICEPNTKIGTHYKQT